MKIVSTYTIVIQYKFPIYTVTSTYPVHWPQQTCKGTLGFPGGSGVKNAPANAGIGFAAGLGRPHMPWRSKPML